MSSFKVNQKVRNIATGAVGEIIEINEGERKALCNFGRTGEFHSLEALIWVLFYMLEPL